MKFSLLQSAYKTGSGNTEGKPKGGLTRSALLKGSVLSLCVLAGFEGYDLSQAASISEALQQEQEMSHFVSSEAASTVDSKSMFDQTFGVGSKIKSDSNLAFIRDSLLHRNDLMCARDAFYVKELSSKQVTYLGCSISPSVGKGGASINTYSIGDQFQAEYSEAQYGEHKEFRTDVVFPSDFKDRVVSVAGKEFATDASRFAIDLKILSRGDAEILETDRGLRAMAGVLAEQKYLHRWVAAGRSSQSFWAAQVKIGSITKATLDKINDLQKEYGEDFLNGWSKDELSEESKSQLKHMRERVDALFSEPAISKINEVLDHSCAFSVSRTTMGGYDIHNNSCVLYAGLSRSPQLVSQLSVKENPLLTDMVHGALDNRLVLGSYKGHAVVTTVVPRENEPAAYTSLPKSTEDWSKSFLKGSFYQPVAINVDSSKDIEAISSIHFSGAFSEQHTPIMVSPVLGDLLNMSALDEQSQRLMVEMTLEHEIKHIKDVVGSVKRGFDPESVSYSDKEAACDIYAINSLFEKYKDPDVLKKLRKGIEVRALGFKNKTEEDVERIKENAGSFGDFLADYQAKKSLKNEQSRHEIVLEFLDNKIQESANKAVLAPSSGVSM